MFDHRFPDTESLRHRARKRIPAFAFDYLDGGCFSDQGLARNREQLQQVLFESRSCRSREELAGSSTRVKLFGREYRFPFGVAPIGLQGLMWPRGPEILAKAARDYQIPYVLSTVSSASVEEIGAIAEGHAWFQLYNPTETSVRRDLIRRVSQAGFPVLVVTVDVPTYGYRPRDIRRGLSMPPKLSPLSISQMLTCPSWVAGSALAGIPRMKTLLYYAPNGEIKPEDFVNFVNRSTMGPVDRDGLSEIRDLWPGALVVKGIMTESDLRTAIEIGADGVVISNHGARQLNRGLSSIEALQRLAPTFKDKLTLLLDSGVQNGEDIAAALAYGAEAVFLGRTFMYGLGALGAAGAGHTVEMLARQFEQVMAQLGCQHPVELSERLVR